MNDTLIPRRDLSFLIHDWLRPDLSDEGRDTVDSILDLSAELAAEVFLPHYKLADQREPSLKGAGVHILPEIGAALRKYAELGLFAAGFAMDLGGLNLPYLVTAASLAQFAAANNGTLAYAGLTVANARLIATFGTQSQIATFARPQIEGRWFGTMCLSEPEAGSSLADIKTRAEPAGEDELGKRYLLTGNKMWISGGDQDVSDNIVHLVLARTHGHDGAAAVGYRGYRLALRYAHERLQGRPPGRRDGPPIPIVEHPDVKRMLLTQKVYVEGELALCLYCAQLVDAGADGESSALLALLTPVAKTWSAEFGVAANDIAIQVHGGYGYTRDFDVEQLYRDNRLNPIHEGTTGIQAIDLLGRKILRNEGAALEIAWARIERTCSDVDPNQALKSHAVQLMDDLRLLKQSIDALRAADKTAMFDNATLFLSAFGHLVVGWLWLDQALAAFRLLSGGHGLAAGKGDQEFLRGKLHACRFYFEYEMPKVPLWLSIVASRTDVVASANPAQF